MRNTSNLSSWSLDLERDPLRMPPRDPVLRHADYEDAYDFTTVVCDVFWDATRPAIHLVGPPLLNLKSDLDFRFRASPTMQPCSFEVRHKWWTDVITVTVPVGTTGLIVETAIGRTFLPVQPSLSDLFAGRRCIFAMSRNKEIAWIQDWVRYYARGHGCNGVVLYDANSDGYGLRDIDDALRAIDPAIEVLVIGWPFKWGVLDGDRPLSHDIWDSFYSQAAAFEQARLRCFAKARSVMNADIDGLAVARDGQSLFEIVEQSDTGFIRFDGWCVHNHTTEPLPQQRRYKHFYHRRKDGLDACLEKWAVVPGRSPEDVQWTSHNVIGMVQDVASFKVRLRQFEPINVSSDVGSSLTTARRTEPFGGSHDDLEVDEELRLTLTRIFGSNDDQGQREPPARSQEAAALHLRVESGRLAARRETSRAIDYARRASDLLPDHPGFRLHLAGLLSESGMKDEAAALEETANATRQAHPLFHLQTGRSAQHVGEIDAAVTHYRKALAIDPLSIDATELLFTLLWSHGRHHEARILAREWSTRAPDLAEPQALAGAQLTAIGCLLEATAFWQRAVALEPRPDFLHALAHCLLLDGQYELAEEMQRTAIRVFEEEREQARDPLPPALTQKLKRQLVQQSSTRSSLLEQLGKILRARGQTEAACEAVREAVQHGWPDPDLRLLLADMLTDAGRAEEALAERNKAVELARELLRDPQATIWTANAWQRDPVGLYAYVSGILLRCGHIDEAIATTEEIARRFGSGPNATIARCNLLVGAGRFDEAERSLRAAIAAGERHPRLHILLSMALSNLDRRPEAIAACEPALALDPSNPNLYRTFGSLLAGQRRWDEAVAALRTAIELNPSHAGAHRQLSAALAALDQAGPALAAARRAVQLAPRDPALQRHLGSLLAAERRWAEAAAAQREAITLTPSHAGAHRQLSAALAALQQPDEALAMARRAVELAPGEAGLHRHLGNLLAAQRRWEEAAAAQRRAIELDPSHAGARRQLDVASAALEKVRRRANL